MVKAIETEKLILEASMKAKLTEGPIRTDILGRDYIRFGRFSGRRALPVLEEFYWEGEGEFEHHEEVLLFGPQECRECKQVFDLRWKPESCKGHEGERPLYTPTTLPGPKKCGRKRAR